MAKGRPCSHSKIPGHDGAFFRHPLWTRWQGMHARCSNKNHIAYPRYGGKGVRVCDRWKDFGLFVLDMGAMPNAKSTVERNDSSGDYSPDNCRWAYTQEQNRNTERNVWVTVGDVTLTVGDWERKNGVACGAYHRRIGLGWPHADAVTLDIEPGKPLKNRSRKNA